MAVLEEEIVIFHIFSSVMVLYTCTLCTVVPITFWYPGNMTTRKHNILHDTENSLHDKKIRILL